MHLLPSPEGNTVAVNSKNWQELKKPTALEKKAGGDMRRKGKAKPIAGKKK